ncbi:uncharacterized protein LOC131874011 [Cryptomeria japonica]|uniref:uncharacterized protein LOC131874011 n=1 Tax=Cryptomeria japonica TaxID=3369 RepID=UPI0027D9DA83|nr:uncharacterized protein LOC131874011 [Cryptomeria japonica]
MDIPQEDRNPNSEVLYTVDIDTQKVNIVVDNDTTGKIDMANEPPVTNGTEGVKPTDFEPNNKYLYDDPVDIEPIDITDDDTGDVDNIVNTADNVDVFEVDEWILDTQQEQVENKGEENEADKSSTKQPVNAQSRETQTTPINVSAVANVNITTEDNQKDSNDKEEEASVKEQTVENPQPVKDTTKEEEIEK